MAPTNRSELDIDGSVSTTDHGDYLEIDTHGDIIIWVKNGQVIENLLIDNSGNHGVQFQCRQSQFTVRNVGITSKQPAHVGPVFAAGSSIEGVIEKVYHPGGLGDWTVKHQDGTTNTHPKFMFTFSEHTGDMYVRDTYVGPMTDNTFYCENQGANGNMHLENVYVYGGCISAYRLGGNGDHTMTNCHADNIGYHTVNSHGGSRDMWLRSGTGSPSVDVYDSDLDGSGSGIVADAGPVRLRDGTQYGGGRGNIREMDGSVGRSPNTQIPSTTPESAMEAATGSSSGGGGGGGGEIGGQDYEEITASGQTIRVGSGETWSNKLIDLGSGGSITIAAKGTNWTIKNIGFKGYHSTSGTAPNSGTIFGIADTGSGTSTMENIFWSEGYPSRPSNNRPIQMWVDPDHNGHLDISRVNFGHAGCNGIYGSAPAYNGNGGTITLDRCYTYDSHHTGLRIGDCGMTIKDCTIYKTGTRSAARGIWVWEGNYSGNARIENTDIITNGTGAAIDTDGSPSISMDNVRTDTGDGTGGTPENVVPDGCPTSPEMAASGGSSGGGGGGGGGSDPVDPPGERFVSGSDEGDYEHVVFLLNNTGSPIDYSLYVENNLVQSNIDSAVWDEENISWDDRQDYEGVTGTVPGDTAHSYFFDGDILAATQSGEFSWSGLDRDESWSPSQEATEPPTSGPRGEVTVDVNGPDSVKVGNTATFNVIVENTTDTDKMIDIEMFFEER